MPQYQQFIWCGSGIAIGAILTVTVQLCMSDRLSDHTVVNQKPLSTTRVPAESRAKTIRIQRVVGDAEKKHSQTMQRGAVVPTEQPAIPLIAFSEILPLRKRLRPSEAEYIIERFADRYKHYPLLEAKILAECLTPFEFQYALDDEETGQRFDRLLNRAIDRVELANFQLQAIRMELRRHRAERAGRSNRDEYIRLMDDVIRVYDEVKTYGRHQDNDDYLPPRLHCEGSYEAAIAALVDLGRGFDGNNDFSFLRGRPVYWSMFTRLAEFEPEVTNVVYCARANDVELAALRWTEYVVSFDSGLHKVRPSKLPPSEFNAIVTVQHLIKRDLREHADAISRIARQFKLFPRDPTSTFRSTFHGR